jgi:hypothetical protein
MYIGFMAVCRPKNYSIDVSSHFVSMQVMALVLPQADFQIQPRRSQKTIHSAQEHYLHWCQLHGLEPTGELFTHFIQVVRIALNRQFDGTLLEAKPFSFGGADGGGGIVVEAQGEDTQQIVDATGDLVSSVRGFSLERYFDILHEQVVEPFPGAIVAEEPEDGHPPHLFVQGEFVDRIKTRIEQRLHLRRNVADIHPLDSRRFHDLEERRHENVPHWHTPALDHLVIRS